jgi:hypothetical protein
MLTPDDLCLKYWWTCFGVDEHGGNIGPVSINKYRLASSNAEKGTAMKNAIINALRSRYKKITGKAQSGDVIEIPPQAVGDWYPNLPRIMDRTGIVRAFNGKGSLEDASLALTAAIATKKVAAERDALQKMADECLGLDCNGFVGNYLKLLGISRPDGHYGPTTPISYYASRGLERKTIDCIKPLDVIIWPDLKHIAIIDSIIWPDLLWVTESASSLGGLDTRQYELTGKTKTGSTTASGKSKVTLVEMLRPTGKGGTKKTHLLVCKVQ